LEKKRVEQVLPGSRRDGLWEKAGGVSNNTHTC
jgi:hypothetical protein